MTRCARCGRDRSLTCYGEVDYRVRKRKKWMFSIAEGPEVWLCGHCRQHPEIRKAITAKRLA